MTQPSVMPNKRAIITQRVALIAIVREWFLYRDEALWAFVGGTEEATPLEPITISEEISQRIAEANEAHQRAWALAERIAKVSELKASTVMRGAIDELLATERPRLLLALEHLPGSF